MRRMRTMLGMVLPLTGGLAACAGASKTPVTTRPATETPAVARQEQRTIESICEDSQVRSWELVGASGEPEAVSRGTCLGKETRGFHLVVQHQPIGTTQPVWEYHLWLARDGSPKSAQLREAKMVRLYFWTAEGVRMSLFGDVEPIEDADDDWLAPSPSPYLDEVAKALGRVVDQPPAQANLTIDGAVSVREIDDGKLAEHLPETPQPSYTPPEGLEITKVTIDGDAKLAGELVRGKGSSEPQPGIVFFSGSGPQERHGFVPKSSIDIGSHAVQDALALAGFTVLRYDDRGVGDSELGEVAFYGYDTIVSDARRALSFLAERPEVDRSRIILVGHSEGALTAALLANDKVGKTKQRLAGIVMMAAAGRNLRDVIYSQIRGKLSDAELAENEVEKMKKIHDAVMDDGHVPEAFEPVRRYFKESFVHEPPQVVQKSRVPVFVAQGSKDFQVDPTLDFGPLRDAVAGLQKRRATKASQARQFEGLDHLFKPEPGQSSMAHYGDLRRRVDPGFIKALVQWCSDRAGIPNVDRGTS